jgi:error-prone DNA polymerase
MGFYAPAQIVRDAERHGVRVLPPDINFSDWDSTLEAEERGVPSAPACHPRESGDPVTDAGSYPALPADTGSPSLARLNAGLAGDDSMVPASRLHPTHAAMASDIRSTHAVRLGFRQVKGFREEDAEAVMAARGGGYDSVRDLWLRTGLSRAAIERLADADAFRSIGLDRRDALWAARGLAGGGEKDRLPLFDRPRHHDIAQEPDVALPPMPVGEHVVNDYRFLSLSL